MALGIPENPRDEEVDMAPMIDMVFLLLVFFMVASHIQSKDFIELEIPRASSARVPEERQDRIVVSVKPDGAFFLGPTEITGDALKEVLAQRNDEFMALTGGERMSLFLRGDADTEHGDIRKVMKMGADAGIVDIIFSTEVDTD